MQVQMSKRDVMTGINMNSFKVILFKKRIIHKPLYRTVTITGCEMPLTTDLLTSPGLRTAAFTTTFYLKCCHGVTR